MSFNKFKSKQYTYLLMAIMQSTNSNIELIWSNRELYWVDRILVKNQISDE